MKLHQGWFHAVAAVGLLSFAVMTTLHADTPTTQPADTDASATPSAEDVMQQLLDESQTGEPIQPTVRPAKPRGVSQPMVTTPIDPAVIGTAPGAKAPTLRREGDFVRSRRGRLVRSADGVHSLFVFEADEQASPESPMILLPCQILENMEQFITDRGDQLLFVLSGQITTYRGANYLLPTMMKLALNDANLY